MEGKTDEELAEIIQEGEVDAFATIVERYESKLVRYGRRFLFGEENIEDAVQEVFLKTYTNIKGFDTTRKFSSWIYKIAHNTFINLIKKHKKDYFLFFEADTIFSYAGKEDILEDIKKEEEKKTIEKYINKMSLKYREPIILYYFEDKDYQEISDILEIPISTVGIRLKRGKGIVKKMLQKNQNS